MKTTLWPPEILQPVIITYNRAESLDKTLKAFLKTDFSSIEFHVLDNASTDNTAAIVKEIQKEWPLLRYHRNLYNIGGNANILRSIEITNSEYSWIIGDDDLWLFEGVEELIEVISARKADIIRLGWLVNQQHRGKLIEAGKLEQGESFFFASLSMISATIVRRELFIKHLPLAYMNLGDAYPQLIPIIAELEKQPLLVYSLEHNMMIHTPSSKPGYYLGDLEWYTAWFRTSRFIYNEQRRSRFIKEAIPIVLQQTKRNQSVLNRISWLLMIVLNYKAFGIKQGTYLLSMLAYGKGLRILLLSVSFVYFCTPRWLAKIIRKAYVLLTRIPDKAPQADRTRL